MEAFSALLAICAGNSPVTGELPTQRPVTRSFDVFFDLRLNKRLSKQSWSWWIETPSRPLWRQCNGGLFPHKDRFPVIKISTSWGRLIIVMVIPMMVRWYFYIETAIALLSVLGMIPILHFATMSRNYMGIELYANSDASTYLLFCQTISRKYVFVVISWPGAVETLDIPPKFILKLKSREISYFSDAQIFWDFKIQNDWMFWTKGISRDVSLSWG